MGSEYLYIEKRVATLLVLIHIAVFGVKKPN